jgi:SAM-dependent methyltransferase
MSAPAELRYVGQELQLFARAHNWKRYWATLLQPYLEGEVLEVGAGLGTNARLLRSNRQRRWVCLEPDPRLFEQLRAAFSNPGDSIESRLGTLDRLDPAERFDVILYIDVLEHIRDDAGELRRAAAHLRDRGRLIVLSPAHPWLFSPFDSALGHHRRYTRKTLEATANDIGYLRLERLWYLDSWGLFASTANRLVLRQALPTLRQIRFWDRLLVPLSRFFDPLLLYRIGKSVLGVWTFHARPN